MKVGIFGGTFDPVHNAHLALARAARDQLKLDKVLFLPTGAPRYRAPAVAGGEHRLAMLRLALGEEPGFEIDARELAPGSSGYTIDTLKELRLEYGPGAQLWFIMGADQYAKLDTWHRAPDIRRMAKIAVVARPGSPFSPDGARVIAFEPMNVGSSDIRRRLPRGEDISAMVPPAVANYIARERLYL